MKPTIGKVKKRNGRIVPFEQKKITRAILSAGRTTGEYDTEVAKKISDRVLRKLTSMYSPKDIPGVEEIQDVVEPTIAEFGYFKTARAYILYREEHKKMRKEKAILGVPDDVGLPINSLRILESRYLLKDEIGLPLETPRQLFERVVSFIAKAEEKWGGKIARQKYEAEFYRLMTSLEFLPNSPTLMNAGTRMGILSACFVLPIPDSLEGIFEAVKATALIHQEGGGTGFSFSRLRPRGDIVRSSGGVASGPVSFMQIFNIATEAIKQGGKRRGANMGILRVDHPDILEFISSKEDNISISNFNISVAVTDRFMEAVKKEEDYDLINPKNGKVVNRLNARKVFDLLVLNAWRNGDPGIIFIDGINRDNPTPSVAEIESTNPCGEQPLMPYESCNLGSINLAKMIKEVRLPKETKGKKEIDWEKLERVVRLSTRFLDDVIEVNKFPLEEISRMTKNNRTIGLGVMGWADVLIDLRIPYNSEKAIVLAEKVMKFITKISRDESVKLGRERGSFPNFKGSKWEKAGFKYMRNRAVTTIAPTGTIGLIANCSQGIEPIFALVHIRAHVLGGEELLYVYEKFEEELKKKGLYSEELMTEVGRAGSVSHLSEIPFQIRKIFVVSYDISPEWHVKMQAAFQKYTDNAVSKTVNFPNNATIEDVEKVYMLAYKLGCKGVTIYRDRSRAAQVLNIDREGRILKAQKESKEIGAEEMLGYPPELSRIPEEKNGICPQCGELMNNGEGCSTCPFCGYSVCSLSQS